MNKHGRTSICLFSLLAAALCGPSLGFRHTSGAVWLMDAADRKCMGAKGFEACSDKTVWSVRGVAGDFRVEFGSRLRSNAATAYTAAAVAQLEQHKQPQPKCLHRDNCFARTSSLSLGSCGRCGGSKWHLTADGALTHRNKTCIGRNGNFAFLQSCNDGHVPLSIVSAAEQAESPASLASLSQQTLRGYHVESSTSLQLPLDLQPIVSPKRGAAPHILVGAGVFTRTLLQIPVYAVGWYVELSATGNVPIPKGQVQPSGVNEHLYELMVARGGYDRSLFMKLAITLPRAMLQEGLIETLAVHKEYAGIFAELCEKHIGGPSGQAREWQHGTELVFTWRKNGILEIRADGELLDRISNAGLAEALFWQFVNDDPISPQAKEAFGEGFLDVLQGNVPRNAFSYAPSTGNGPTHTADRVLAEQVTLVVTLALGLLALLGIKSATSLPKLSFRRYNVFSS